MTDQADRIPTRGVLSSAQPAPNADNRPAFALVRAFVEPPGGIEPPTPSLPWNHQEPLCGPRFSQVTLDRQGRSYGFCFDAVMRSLLSGVVAAVGVVGPQRHRGVGGRADRRAVDLDPGGGDPASCRISTDIGQPDHGVVGLGQQQRHRGYARQHVHLLPPPQRLHQLEAGHPKWLVEEAHRRMLTRTPTHHGAALCPARTQPTHHKPLQQAVDVGSKDDPWLDRKAAPRRTALLG
jgi:hypothetical protein